MKVIVGLGNPGKKYENTRHNVGFLVLDKVSKMLNIPISTKKFKAEIGEGFIGGEKIILVKPQTFMNLSGTSVREVLSYYDIDLDDLCVVTDDLDLSVGSLRLREKGSSAGQKGIQNIIDCLGTQEFLRVKVGIGKNPMIQTVDWVLGKIDSMTALDSAADCVCDFAKNTPLLELKNRYNIKV